MSDEDLILDDDALANERVRGYLAVRADQSTFLNFDERTDLAGVADGTTIQVN